MSADGVGGSTSRDCQLVWTLKNGPLGEIFRGVQTSQFQDLLGPRGSAQRVLQRHWGEVHPLN